MNTLVIFGHPNPDSFNGAILKTVENTLQEKGHNLVIKNLYGLNFNPILTLDDFIKMKKGTVADDVALEQNEVRGAQNIIFIYPIWWMGQPAIVKGWIDRVLSYGFAYAPQEDGTVKGLLGDKKVRIITTCDDTEKNMIDSGLLWAKDRIFIEGTLGFCGIRDVIHKTFFEVSSVDDKERNMMLDEVISLVDGLY